MWAARMGDDSGKRLRTILCVLSLQRVAAAIALAVLVTPVIDAAIGRNEVHAEEEALTVAVGTELMATADVTLHQAEIARGSRVSVTKLNVREGRLDSVNVALADGHVVKMPLVAVRSYFRVVVTE